MRVALTFDAEHPDRPVNDARAPAEILRILADESVRATFFLQGRWVEAFPQLARRVATDGHLVGSHSFFHARMPLLSDDGLRTDIQEAERAIREIAFTDPRPWFRCPFGDGQDDPRVLAALDELGYRCIGWDVWSYDWAYDATADAVEQAVLTGVLDRGDRAIVLLHTWSSPTRDALSSVIAKLRAQSVELATVSELVN